MNQITKMNKFLTKVNKNVFIMMSLFLSLTVFISCDKDEEPTANPSNVVASFSGQVDADNSLVYDFTNNSVVNGITDKTYTSSWDFGGDGTSTDANPSHTFSGEGSYEVKLTVTAADGVKASASETIEVTAPKNRYAVITDSRDDDNGELRLALDSIQKGRMTFMYRVAEGPGMDIQDAFINVSGSSTTGDLALVEVRLKDNAKHEFREGASDDVIAAADANFPEGMPNVWVPIEITWTANGVTAPTFSLFIDGKTIIIDAVSTTNGGAGDVADHLAAVKDGAANIQWKYSDKSKVSDGVFHIDNIVVYSSNSGSEVVVFEDNFQARVLGESLSPADNLDSPYHANTLDASVGEDQ